jgi:hypothetical protein
MGVSGIGVAPFAAVHDPDARCVQVISASPRRHVALSIRFDRGVGEDEVMRFLRARRPDDQSFKYSSGVRKGTEGCSRSARQRP